MKSVMDARMVRFVVLLFPCFSVLASDEGWAPSKHNERTLSQLQAEMSSGRLTSEQLTREYIARIVALDQNGPGVNSVIALNPDALSMARRADALRRQGKVLGPLHGIPVLLKDNIDTGDRMQTTAGSLGLVGAPAKQDATVAANLRAGGAVLLGKTNMSEWSNFRSFASSGGWSAVGGQTNNPYGINRSPCGSSSGSGAAVSANFTAVSIGTETNGSIVCPANANGIVGIKPTVGLTSRAGVVPVSHTQDTVGAHARTVADAAITLSVVQSLTADTRDPATAGVPLGWTGRPRPENIPTDYTQFLDPNGLRGARIGVTRRGGENAPPQVVEAFEATLDAIEAAGATLVDLDGAGFSFSPADGEYLVLCYEFRDALRTYLATRVGVPLGGKTLADAIAFNNANAEKEMPFFGQDIFEQCNRLAPGPEDPQPDFGNSTYKQALEIDRLSGVNGIDKAIADFNLDAVMTVTNNPPWPTDLLYGDRILFASSTLAAAAGYPIVQVPAGNVLGLPLGVSFFGTAFSEPKLIKLASGFEAVTQERAKNLPTFAPMLPAAKNVKGASTSSARARADSLSTADSRRQSLKRPLKKPVEHPASSR